jgi:hypothetical protein
MGRPVAPVGRELGLGEQLLVDKPVGKIALTHEVIRGGNFSKPKPPLFPMNGGRNYQRAFRDMLADVLPPARGWEPTIRIAHFEVVAWLKA